MPRFFKQAPTNFIKIIEIIVATAVAVRVVHKHPLVLLLWAIYESYIRLKKVICLLKQTWDFIALCCPWATYRIRTKRVYIAFDEIKYIASAQQTYRHSTLSHCENITPTLSEYHFIPLWRREGDRREV